MYLFLIFQPGNMKTLIEKKHPHEGDNEMVNLEILLEFL